MKSNINNFPSSTFIHNTRVHELVTKARQQYRKTKGFTEDQYITFLAPGNCEKEAKFSIKSFVDGLKVFTSREAIKSINKTFFRVLVLLPKNKV